MSEEFGSDFITIVDDDGAEFELEVLDTMDYKGQSFVAFLPANMDEEDPDYYLLNGDELDIDDLLESVFILGMDPQILCRDDCKGLCPRCGADLNEGGCRCQAESDPRLAVLEQLLDDIDQTN